MLCMCLCVYETLTLHAVGIVLILYCAESKLSAYLMCLLTSSRQ